MWHTPERVRKLLLTGGFLAAATGIVLAHLSPADGYELSLYTGTPAAVWAFLLVGAVAAISVLVYTDDPCEGRLASVLAGLVVLTFLGMPLIRGYYFYGLSDALNHLGFARKIASDHRGFFTFIYPGPQTFAIAVARFTGWGLPQAMLLVTTGFAGVFVLFVPLAVSKIVENGRAVGMAVVAGLLMMPINNISTTMQFNNFSMAMLFSPLVLYLFLSHVTGDAEDGTLPSSLTAVSLLMPLAGGALLLFHPLTMFDFLAVIGATAGLQLVIRLRRPDHPVAGTRAVYGQVVLLGALWLFWSSGHIAFERTTAKSVETLLAIVAGTAQTAPDVQSTTASAHQLDVNLWVLFVKLLLVEFVAGLVAVGLIVWHWTGRLTPESGEHSPTISYFAVGGLALLPVVFVQLHGNVSHLFFRHLGFGYVIVTMLLAVGLNRVRNGISVDWGVVRPVVVIVAVVAIVVSMAALYPSPYIYRFNHHVTDGHMTGYEATYEAQPPEDGVWFASFRAGTRYKTALAAAPGTSWYPGIVKPAPRISGAVPPSAMESGLQEYYETYPEPSVRRDHYVPISEATVEREVRLYDGQRYSAAAFDSLSTQKNVHRIRTSDAITWYYVDVDESDGAVVDDSNGAVDDDSTDAIDDGTGAIYDGEWAVDDGSGTTDDGSGTTDDGSDTIDDSSGTTDDGSGTDADDSGTIDGGSGTNDDNDTNDDGSGTDDDNRTEDDDVDGAIDDLTDAIDDGTDAVDDEVDGAPTLLAAQTGNIPAG